MKAKKAMKAKKKKDTRVRGAETDRACKLRQATRAEQKVLVNMHFEQQVLTKYKGKFKEKTAEALREQG